MDMTDASAVWTPAQRPRRLITSLLWGEGLFIGIMAGFGLAVPVPMLSTATWALAGLFGVTAIARALERRGKAAAATLLVGYCILGHALVQEYLLPFGEGPLAVSLILAVVTVLPDHKDRTLRIFLAVTVLCAGGLALIHFWSPYQSAGTSGSKRLLAAVSMIAAATLVLTLLAQFSTQLQRALGAEAQARRSAEESAALLDALFTSAPIGLSFLDREQRYVRINKALAEINGTPAQAHIGRRVEEILPELAPRVAAAHRHAIEHDCTVIAEFSAETPGAPGVRRDWLVSYYPVRLGGRVFGSGAVVLDLTDRKKAYVAAQQAVRLRDDFISVASHELKTPLTALRLQVDGFRRTMARGPVSPDRLAKLGDDLDHSVSRLDRLVDDLLDFSRLASGRLDLRIELVDWAALVDELGERFAPHLEEAHCPLALHLDPAVVGSWDRLRLEQITTNLLSNAIKYGGGAPIELTLSADPARATLCVRDHGIGIAVEDQTRIFERFERAVSSRSYGGFGLGLWIVRRVIEALGGTIAVESRPGMGATFTVTLPRERPSAGG
jgi:PAS domain S-box-containing protein